MNKEETGFWHVYQEPDMGLLPYKPSAEAKIKGQVYLCFIKPGKSNSPAILILPQECRTEIDALAARLNEIKAVLVSKDTSTVVVPDTTECDGE